MRYRKRRGLCARHAAQRPREKPCDRRLLESLGRADTSPWLGTVQDFDLDDLSW